ncbi:MAG: hypothetical protein HYX43_19895 [Burkholderiales bacterium]|nr:hypothetical protein [Burkholderiales bacterium]
MSNTESETTPPAGTFFGPTEFAQVVREALACAAREGWPSMVWSDPNFADWPLGERAVVETLNAWAGGGRHLVILAHNFDSVVRLHPRFVTWRQTWDHVIECRVCRNLDATEVPSALWSPHWAMRRLDLVRSTGVAGLEPQRRVMLKEELDECRRQGAPGFPASTLGL